MKRMIMLAMMAAGVACAQEAVRVEPTDGGAMVGVDIAGGPGRMSRAWSAVKTHKWKIIGTAAAVIAVDRVAANNDWLWYERDDKPKPKPTPPAPVEGLGIATFGNDSPVYIETQAGNISVQTHGNNSPIVVKEPPPVEVEE